MARSFFDHECPPDSSQTCGDEWTRDGTKESRARAIRESWRRHSSVVMKDWQSRKDAGGHRERDRRIFGLLPYFSSSTICRIILHYLVRSVSAFPRSVRRTRGPLS